VEEAQAWRTDMKIVQGDKVEEVVRQIQHRQGLFQHRRLMTGEPGTLGNFVLELVRTTDDFFSPRHKHNFDQFRYQVEGEFDFDRNGKMAPGVIGYFPEGTPYGPQTSSVSSLTLVLQFGGASRSGYMTHEDMEASTVELKKFGQFEKGVYRRNDGVEGKRNVDGYQAVWENFNKRSMKYPEPRYNDPIMMNPEYFDWVAVDGSPGVYDKLMGVFTERRCSAQFLKLDAQGQYRAHGRALYFVLSGEGRIATEYYRRFTTMYCQEGEDPVFTAARETEILMLGLPRVDAMAAHAVAAQ
jgi:hypothetical protein